LIKRANLCQVLNFDKGLPKKNSRKLNENLLMKMIALAPIEVEILLFFFFKKIKDWNG
jgi:hypothetical protein